MITLDVSTRVHVYKQDEPGYEDQMLLVRSEDRHTVHLIYAGRNMLVNIDAMIVALENARNCVVY